MKTNAFEIIKNVLDNAERVESITTDDIRTIHVVIKKSTPDAIEMINQFYNLIVQNQIGLKIDFLGDTAIRITSSLKFGSYTAYSVDLRSIASKNISNVSLLTFATSDESGLTPVGVNVFSPVSITSFES